MFACQGDQIVQCVRTVLDLVVYAVELNSAAIKQLPSCTNVATVESAILHIITVLDARNPVGVCDVHTG